MRFTFIHAADLHIDSPFAALGDKDAAVAARFAAAGRKAVEALVAETIDSNAAFLVIAGDIFDGDWKDVTTGLFFARQLGKLHRANIPTFLIKGNHDAENLMSRTLTYPNTVHTFDSRKAETMALDDLRVALHGRSFGSRKVADDFVHSYPPRREGWLNIGVLHTALDGSRGHESYAPCTADDLRRFGYDYWALGHIHAAEIVARDPWIVYPGNLQGRSVRETGAKGAVRVTVDDGRVVDVERLELDAARWAHEQIDVSGCANEDSVLELIRNQLERLHDGCAGRPLAVRVTLAGETALHTRLSARLDFLHGESRAIGFQVAEDCWIEQLKLATIAPPRSTAPSLETDTLDIGALLAAVARDPAFSAIVSDLKADISSKLPRDLRDMFTEDGDDAVGSIVEEARDYLLGSLPR